MCVTTNRRFLCCWWLCETPFSHQILLLTKINKYPEVCSTGCTIILWEQLLFSKILTDSNVTISLVEIYMNMIYCQGTWIQTHHCQTRHRRNLIRRMTPIQVNQRKRNAIRMESVVKTRRLTLQTHHRAILICPLTAITGANNGRGKAIRKRIR